MKLFALLLTLFILYGCSSSEQSGKAQEKLRPIRYVSLIVQIQSLYSQTRPKNCFFV